jgi:phosphate transport system substrate-binding protein
LAITGATFILMHKIQDKPEQAKNVLKFFEWSYSKGDQDAQNLDYIPMPDNVKNAIKVQWNALKGVDGKAIR